MKNIKKYLVFRLYFIKYTYNDLISRVAREGIIQFEYLSNVA